MAEKGCLLRVAHLAFSALPATMGGLEIVVDSLIRRQQAAGHDATLVTRWRQWRAAREAGLPYAVLPLPPNSSLSSRPFRSVGPRWPVAATVQWHQMRHRFDVWHIHWLYPTAWMVYDALERLGAPVVVTAHGADLQMDEESGYGFRQFAIHDRRVRQLAPRLPVLTAISDSIEARYRELGVPSGHIHRIPNGVDARRLKAASAAREAVRARLALPPRAQLILSVGRNQPSKGFGFIPETLATLRRGGREAIWVVAGKNSEALLPAAKAAGVAEAMRLLPPIWGKSGADAAFPPDELAELYAAADVFAFPSLVEAFGLVVIEAMAAGAPVVGNDVSGIRNVITNGLDGLLCAPRSPTAMAAAISRVLDDPALAVRLAEAGRIKAVAHDWDMIASRYLDLYRLAISQSPGEAGR